MRAGTDSKIQDGYPLPSAGLIFLVIGQYSLAHYHGSGIRSAKDILDILKKNGLDIEQFKSVGILARAAGGSYGIGPAFTDLSFTTRIIIQN